MTKAIVRTALAATLLSLGLASHASAEDAKPKKEMSPAQAAMHERQKTCGTEWKAAKASGKVEDGMKWSKYWSECNKRLKAEKKA